MGISDGTDFWKRVGLWHEVGIQHSPRHRERDRSPASAIFDKNGHCDAGFFGGIKGDEHGVGAKLFRHFTFIPVIAS